MSYDAIVGQEVSRHWQKKYCRLKESIVRNSIPIRSVVVAAALALGTLAGASQKTRDANPGMLVSTAWLAEHAKEPKVVILHVAMSRDEYAAEHIPGARFFDIHAVATMGAPGAELPPPEEIKRSFEAVGVSDDTRVVFYAPDWQPQAARAWFALDYIGHGDHGALLNGGMEQWLREKRPLSAEVPSITPGNLTLKMAATKLIGFEEVKKLSQSGGAVPERRPCFGNGSWSARRSRC
jgi:3-mercaptopyruvate sulfurtransferase SseA